MRHQKKTKEVQQEKGLKVPPTKSILKKIPIGAMVVGGLILILVVAAFSINANGGYLIPRNLTASPAPFASASSADSLNSVVYSPPPLTQKVDTDPVVPCGPGVKSGQYVNDKQSNCVNYTDCGLNGNTVWTLMLKSDCSKKQAQGNAANNSNNNTSSNSGTVVFPCPTSTGTYMVHGENEGKAMEECNRFQANDRQYMDLQNQLQQKITNNIINSYFDKPYKNNFVQPTFSPMPYTNLGSNPSPAPCTPIPPGRGGFADNPC